MHGLHLMIKAKYLMHVIEINVSVLTFQKRKYFYAIKITVVKKLLGLLN